MRILFLLTYYYPHWTGLTQYARRLAEGFVKRGYKVTVLTTKHGKGLKDEEVVNGVEVKRKPILFRLSRTFISPQFIFSFWEEIGRCDRVVIYLPFAEVLIAAILARIFKKKLYLVHNGDLVLPKGYVNRIIKLIYYWSTFLAMKLATKIIVYTEDYSNHSKLLLNFKNKWVRIWPLFTIPKPNPVRIDVLKKKYKLDNKKIIGFSGRFVEEKGVDILLKAIPEVISQIPKAHFVFAGETKIAYENFYEQNVVLIRKNKKNITFLGLIQNAEKLAAFYATCHCLVLPSRTECLGSVQVEAMLLDIPVVATNIPGARMIVKKTGMGVVVKKEDQKSLAKGIIKVLENRRKYTNLNNKVSKIFDYQKTLDQYESLILNEHPKLN